MYKGRAAIAAVVFSVVALVHGGEIRAQTDYPNKPVKVVMPFPPGGAPDMVGRLLSQRLSERLGQQFVLENRVGAGGNIGVEFVAKSAPDGYTLLATADYPLVINPTVYPKLPFNPVRDFSPIVIAASDGFVMMGCPTIPTSSVPDLLALARSRPGQLNYASSGYGSNHHLAGEMLKYMAGINIVHVPYKGFGLSVIDAMSCKVELVFGSISASLPHIKGGKLKALAVTTASRHPALPGTPTFIESGFPGFEVEFYVGLLAPAGTPKTIIDRLYTEVAGILKEKATIERLSTAGLAIVPGTPKEFAARIAADLAKYAKVAKAVGLRVD